MLLDALSGCGDTDLAQLLVEAGARRQTAYGGGAKYRDMLQDASARGSRPHCAAAARPGRRRECFRRTTGAAR